ncbi:MAG: glutamate-cysteine ligase family protein [Aulosira sp. DedQUE10]|nr:glutamate-cysteine ligase family protein [Aulosira sp. DedQUE10]
MSSETEEFTIGVEEEYQIINPVTRELSSRVERILPQAQKVLGEEVQPEAQRSQIEIGTPICHTLADVRSELVRLRREVIAAAAKDGKQIAAAGTHPFSDWEEQKLTPKERYQGLMRNYMRLLFVVLLDRMAGGLYLNTVQLRVISVNNRSLKTR